LGGLSALRSDEVFQRFVKSEVQEVEAAESQKVTFTLTSGIGSVMIDVLGSFSQIISDFVLLTIIIIALFASNTLLSLAVIFYFVLIFMGINFKLSKLAQISGKIKYASFVKQNEIVLDSIIRFRELSISGGMSEQINSFRESKTSSTNALVNWQWMNNAPKYLIEFSLFLGLGLILAVHTLFQDLISIEDITFFLVASSRIVPSMLRIQQSNMGIQSTRESIQQTIDLTLNILEPSSNANFEKNFEFESAENIDSPLRLRCENLTFRYKGSKCDVISNLSLSVEPGEFVALVGESGAGKSTLFDLLTGVLNPSEGHVYIGNISARNHLLQNHGGVAIVEQEQILPSASLVKIITGHDFDDLFPIDQELFNNLVSELRLSGLKTNSIYESDIRIGEMGQQVSGGEKQRIAIARALFQKPRLLFLDEVTSALDPATQLSIQETLNSHKREMTILMITHRVEVRDLADRVIEISKEFLTGSK
jgi:ABC-type bacteriocin/lantibiotic exporter with double-glycine peptidase domain